MNPIPAVWGGGATLKRSFWHRLAGYPKLLVVGFTFCGPVEEAGQKSIATSFSISNAPGVLFATTGNTSFDPSALDLRFESTDREFVVEGSLDQDYRTFRGRVIIKTVSRRPFRLGWSGVSPNAAREPNVWVPAPNGEQEILLHSVDEDEDEDEA